MGSAPSLDHLGEKSVQIMSKYSDPCKGSQGEMEEMGPLSITGCVLQDFATSMLGCWGAGGELGKAFGRIKHLLPARSLRGCAGKPVTATAIAICVLSSWQKQLSEH